jgi:acetyl esterase/lipase
MGEVDLVFLVVSVIGALYTLNALRPFGTEHPWLSIVSWFNSWLVIELAPFVLVLQVVLALGCAVLGGILTPIGWLAALISVASWIGLGLIIARSLAVPVEIHRAFAGLDLPKVEHRHLPVRRTRDVTYARVGRKDLKLDVFQPRDAAPAGSLRPAILQIHGGAWVSGDKRSQGLPLVRHLASQGWVGFNANYRLSPKATFPDHLVDLKRAVAWIRAHAAEYGADPRFVVVTGGSAGGHLATLLALTANDPRYQPGFEDADTSIQAAVPFYGVYDFTPERGYYPAKTIRRFYGRLILKASPDRHPERFREASCFTWVRPDAPPLLAVHGTSDSLAPIRMGRDFVAALRSVSAQPVDFLELRGAQHAFEVFPSIRTRFVIRAVDRWLEHHWDRHRAAAGLVEERADLPAARPVRSATDS